MTCDALKTGVAAIAALACVAPVGAQVAFTGLGVEPGRASFGNAISGVGSVVVGATASNFFTELNGFRWTSADGACRCLGDRASSSPE
jgi:hypothetical protein